MMAQQTCLIAALALCRAVLPVHSFFGLFLTFIEVSPGVDAPRLADILLAILLFADEIALSSYSVSGLQMQLNVLAEFLAARGLTVKVKKIKILVFEHRKSTSPAFLYGNRAIERVNKVKHLGMLMHGIKALSPAIDLLCKATRRATLGLQRRCQQLSIHDLVLKCKLISRLVRPILCYCCEFWYVQICDQCLEGTAWGPGPYKDTPRIGRVWEVPIACDMATPSCRLPEEAGANATGKDPQTSFRC